MTTGMVTEQNVEKQQIDRQIGCMAGFFQIFDRHQILSGKRIYSTKRLPLTTVVDPAPGQVKPIASPTAVKELDSPKAKEITSPDRLTQQQAKPRSPLPGSPIPLESQTNLPLPLAVFELKERTRSSWKFAKEAPRLSLDSRAVTDAKGSLHPKEIRTNAVLLSTNRCENPEDGSDNESDKHRSPSVIARLMGLGPLPNSNPEPEKKVELRRSASESRVNRDVFQYRFFDSTHFQLKQPHQVQQPVRLSNVSRDNAVCTENHNMVMSNGRLRTVDRKEFAVRNAKMEPSKATSRGIGQKKSFFDSADFFPEPKQTVSIYGEIKKRLKMRGIDEPSKDLETLKQILEALQLKGLLHSKKSTSQTNERNFVHDGDFSLDESPIIVMRPARSGSTSLNRPGNGRNGRHSPASSVQSSPRPRRIANETHLTVSPRRDNGPDTDVRNPSRVRSASSPTRIDRNFNRRMPFKTDTQSQRAANDTVAQRRISPVHSPKISSLRRNLSDQAVAEGSPRTMRKPTAAIYNREKGLASAEDDLFIVSESSMSMSSQSPTGSEIWNLKVEDYKEGRNLLERCDKLLHSIAEITASNTAELQPSPVSVLDSSLYRDEWGSPSPVMKRQFTYKGAEQHLELDDDIWGSAACGLSDDCDFIYVSDVLRASNYAPEDCNAFLLLEKQQCLKGKDTSKVSRLERRLIFDTINEILKRNRQLPPWKLATALGVGKGRGQETLLQRICSELRRIKERDESEDLFEVICGLLKKDLAVDGINGWGDFPVEMGELVLDMERLIFKDLIVETIHDLAAFPGQTNSTATTPTHTGVAVLRRKLMF